jgi:hypothetical protein
LTVTYSFDSGLKSIWTAHLAMDGGRWLRAAKRRDRGPAAVLGGSGRRQFAGEARNRAPSGQILWAQDENEAWEMRNPTECLKRRERRRKSRSAPAACGGGWRSGGGAVRVREEERGGVRGDAGALHGLYRLEERKGRRRGSGGASAMAGRH